MRLLVISDLHCEDSTERWRYYHDLLHLHNPDVVLGLGDWGECERYELYGKVITIYGNHDNLKELNAKSLILDGEAVTIEGVRIGGISGIVSPKGGYTKSGVPRKRPEEFIERARALRGVEVLMLHETPYMPQVFGRQWKAVGPLAALQAFKEVSPKVLLVGHMHKAPALHAEYDGTHVFHVDTSVGGYLVIETDGKRWRVIGKWYGMDTFRVTVTFGE